MGCLYIHTCYALFLGSFFDNTEHRHHAIQFCYGLDGPITLSVENSVLNGRSFLIASDISHRIIDGEGELGLLVLDPGSEMSTDLIQRLLEKKPVVSPDLPSGLQQRPDSSDAAATGNYINALFGVLGVSVRKKTEDERVLKALAFIESHLLDKITVPMIAEEAALSESRLQHLFKEQVGIPLQRFMLWRRILFAVKELQHGADLTETAYQAGFADSAHFSRTFKQMFGVRLKDIFKAKGRIDIVYLD